MHFTTCNRTSWFQVWHGTNRFYRVAFILFNGFGCLLLCNISFIMADRSDKELLFKSHFIRKNKKHFFKSSTKFILAFHILSSHLFFYHGNSHLFIFQSIVQWMHLIGLEWLTTVSVCVCVCRETSGIINWFHRTTKCHLERQRQRATEWMTECARKCIT